MFLKKKRDGPFNDVITDSHDPNFHCYRSFKAASIQQAKYRKHIRNIWILPTCCITIQNTWLVWPQLLLSIFRMPVSTTRASLEKRYRRFMYKMKSRGNQPWQEKEQPDILGPNFHCKIGGSTKLIAAIGCIQCVWPSLKQPQRTQTSDCKCSIGSNKIHCDLNNISSLGINRHCFDKRASSNNSHVLGKMAKLQLCGIYAPWKAKLLEKTASPFIMIW